MTPPQTYDAIIIGGGPAGTMAALRSSQRNKRVVLIERNKQLGRKLLLSGHGRCNLTNTTTRESEEFLGAFSETRDFLRNAFAQFFIDDLMQFFEQSGLPLKSEADGRVFSVSNKSADVLSVLETHLKKNNVDFIFEKKVVSIDCPSKTVTGVLLDSREKLTASSIVICTGGKSYPSTGSTGDGYTLAQQCGHTIILPQPALTPIEIKESFIAEWEGISLKHIQLAISAGNKKVQKDSGDIVFTQNGISGPAALNLSADTYEALRASGPVAMTLNFKPNKSPEELREEFLFELGAFPNQTIYNAVGHFLPQRMAPALLGVCAIDPNKKINQVTAEKRENLLLHLRNFKVTAARVGSFEEAMMTRGGISTKEINPKTMESKLIKGLFFAGEVIDVDAKSGGYNLQAAFSTGWVCGEHL